MYINTQAKNIIIAVQNRKKVEWRMWQHSVAMASFFMQDKGQLIKLNKMGDQ